jgi:hypothetical protein
MSQAFPGIGCEGSRWAGDACARKSFHTSRSHLIRIRECGYIF